MKKRGEQPRIPATNSGPRPEDFPLGSVESRAAVRALISRLEAQNEKAATIYQASWVGHPQDEDFEILDLNTGLPTARDTTANGTRSGFVVQQDEDLRGAEIEEHKAQTAKVVQGKEEDDLLILDYEPDACRNPGR